MTASSLSRATAARPAGPTMRTTTPIRTPDVGDPHVMTVRAVWLIVLNFLLPGSAQAVAGSRRLGKIGLVGTIAMWLLVILAAVLWYTNQGFVLAAATTVWVLWAVQIVAIAYIVLWVVLTLDTLRLVKLVRTGPIARFVIAVVALLALAVPALAAGQLSVVAASSRDILGTVFNSGAAVVPPVDGRYNILLLGGDSGADRYGLRPDSISVVSIEADTGRVAIIGIPRNQEQIPFNDDSPLHTVFPDGYNCGDECLVSYLYTYASENPDLYPKAKKQGSTPGIEATRDAVEGMLGIQLQYYALIDMQGFEKLIDALGGVDMNVKERLPVGGHLNDVIGVLEGVDYWLEPGKQHLSGHDALWYGRSRATTTDYDRMKRQRQLQQALLKQFSPETVFTRFTDVAAAGKSTLKTDIPSDMLGYFVQLAVKAQDHKIERLELVPDAYNPAYPDYTQIRQDVQDLLAPLPASASGG